jgi:hypothetical protein
MVGKYWLRTLLRVREALDMSSLLVRQEHNRGELRQQCGVLRYERVLGFFVAFSSTNLRLLFRFDMGIPWILRHSLFWGFCVGWSCERGVLLTHEGWKEEMQTDWGGVCDCCTLVMRI